MSPAACFWFLIGAFYSLNRGLEAKELQHHMNRFWCHAVTR